MFLILRTANPNRDLPAHPQPVEVTIVVRLVVDSAADTVAAAVTGDRPPEAAAVKSLSTMSVEPRNCEHDQGPRILTQCFLASIHCWLAGS